MTRSRSAAVAVALCIVVAACSSGDDDPAGLGEAQGSTTSSVAAPTTATAPTTTAAPATASTTAAPPSQPEVTPSTPEEQAAVDAVDRWLALEDQAFTAGTTEAVIDELDALVLDGSILVQGSLDLAGPVDRTSRARIDRIWHPDEGVTRLDVCKTIETPAGEARTAHTITATAGATPFLQNETVYILERDGVTCPPDDIIEPVLATYERWMELNTASALDPTADATELHELSGPEVTGVFTDVRANLAATGGYEVFDPPLGGALVSHSPTTDEATVFDCHEVEDGRGAFDATGNLVSGTSAGESEQVHAGLRQGSNGWTVISFWIEEDLSWCAERLS